MSLLRKRAATDAGPFAGELVYLASQAIDIWAAKLPGYNGTSTAFVMDDTIWKGELAICSVGTEKRNACTGDMGDDALAWVRDSGVVAAMISQCLIDSENAVSVDDAPEIMTQPGSATLLQFASIFFCNRMAQAASLDETGLDDICAVALYDLGDDNGGDSSRQPGDDGSTDDGSNDDTDDASDTGGDGSTDDTDEDDSTDDTDDDGSTDDTGDTSDTSDDGSTDDTGDASDTGDDGSTDNTGDASDTSDDGSADDTSGSTDTSDDSGERTGDTTENGTGDGSTGNEDIPVEDGNGSSDDSNIADSSTI
jgi:hypothetical protein